MLKVKDTFWEYNEETKTGYPRIAHSENHVKYFYKHYKDFTFYTEEEMKKYKKVVDFSLPI